MEEETILTKEEEIFIRKMKEDDFSILTLKEEESISTLKVLPNINQIPKEFEKKHIKRLSAILQKEFAIQFDERKKYSEVDFAKELLGIRKKLLSEDKTFDMVQTGPNSLIHSICHQLQLITSNYITVDDISQTIFGSINEYSTDLMDIELFSNRKLPDVDLDEIFSFNKENKESGIGIEINLTSSNKENYSCYIQINSLQFAATLVAVMTKKYVYLPLDFLYKLLDILSRIFQRSIIIHLTSGSKKISIEEIYQPMKDNPFFEKINHNKQFPIQLCLFESTLEFASVVPLELPIHLFTDSIQQTINTQVDDIIKFLNSKDCPSPLKNCKQISNINLHSSFEEFKIGIFGCTGAGKTTFINAILDMFDTLFVPEKIGAGTSSITEIKSSDELGDDKIRLHITFLSQEIVNEDIKEYSELRENINKLNSDQKETGKQFEQFENRVKSLVDNLNSGTLKIKEALLKKINLKEEVIIIDRADSKEKIKLYIANEENGEVINGLNSVVERVRIEGKFTCLPPGIVLVDMPGLNDRNIFRQRLTRDYLSKCDHICIALPVDDSAMNREHYDKLIKDNLEGHPANQLSLIVTKMETQLQNIPRQKKKKMDLNLETHKKEVEVLVQIKEKGLIEIFKGISKDTSKPQKKQIKRWADSIRVFCTSSVAFEDIITGETQNEGYFHPECTGIPSFRRFLSNSTILLLESIKVKSQQISNILPLILQGHPLQVLRIVHNDDEFTEALNKFKYQIIEKKKELQAAVNTLGNTFNEAIQSGATAILSLYDIIKYKFARLFQSDQNALAILMKHWITDFQTFFEVDHANKTRSELIFLVNGITKSFIYPEDAQSVLFHLLMHINIVSIKIREAKRKTELILQSSNLLNQSQNQQNLSKSLANYFSQQVHNIRTEIEQTFDDFYEEIDNLFENNAVVEGATDEQLQKAKEFVTRFCKNYMYDFDTVNSKVLRNNRNRSRKQDENLEAALLSLVGLDDVKNHISNINKQIAFEKSQKKVNIKSTLIPRQLVYVFKGPPGTGKKSVVRIISSLLKKNEILEKETIIVSNRSNFVDKNGNTDIKTKDFISKNAAGGILFVGDLSSFMDSYGKGAIESICEVLENYKIQEKSLAVILSGTEEEMDKIYSDNECLRGIWNEEFIFPQMKIGELTLVLIQMIDEYKLKPRDLDHDFVVELLKCITTEEMRSENNALICREVLNCAIVRMNFRIALFNDQSIDLMEITRSDFEGLTREMINKEVPVISLDMFSFLQIPFPQEDIFSELIGGESIKSYCKSMWVTEEINKRRKEIIPIFRDEKPVILITGTSGVGKSTAVNMLVKFFRTLSFSNTNYLKVSPNIQLNPLSRNNMIEINKNVKGGILYVDGVIDVKKSKFDEIMNFLEYLNQAKKTIIIISMHPNKVSQIFKAKSGLKRRITHIFQLPGLSHSNIAQILKRKCSNTGPTSDIITPDIFPFESIVERCVSIKEIEKKGGRIAEDLLKVALGNRVHRVLNDHPNPTPDQLKNLEEQDFTKINKK